MERSVALFVVGSAVVASLLATALVAVPVLGAGATLENPGGVVLGVDPGGLAWQDGIRVGQEVVSLRRADEPGGWRIMTETIAGEHLVSSAARHERKLRATWPLVAGSLICAVLAATRVRNRRREAEMAASAALLFAAVPASIAADSGTSAFALSAAMLLPAAWLFRWSGLPKVIRISALSLAVSVAAGWLAVGTVASHLYDPIDQTRFASTVLLGTLMLTTAVARRPPAGGGWLADPQVSTGLSLALLVGIGLVLYTMVRVPLPAVVALAIASFIAFRRVRHLLRVGIDRLVFTDVRERSATAAMESERARLAREIHDSPLQELSGVIRKLDLLPAAARETESLRQVAEQLRSVATELYPPALDDLGLAAALKFITKRAQEDAPNIALSFAIREMDSAGRRGERPAPEVELAVLRIVQEALTNAVRHSGASRIQLTGAVSPSAIRIAVEDDGRGLSRAALRRAQERGSLGMVSMERRAAAIGADFQRRGAKPSGTRVEVRWRA